METKYASDIEKAFNNLSPEEKTTLYLSPKVYDYLMTTDLCGYTSRFVPSPIRRQVEDIFNLCPDILPCTNEMKKSILQILKVVLVDGGEEPANSVLLKNGFLNPRFIEKIRSMGFIYTYPISRVTPPLYLSGDNPEEDFWAELRDYDENLPIEIRYYRGRGQDQVFSLLEIYRNESNHSHIID